MDDVDQIRAFNRMWTRQVGLLEGGLAQTALSQTEARVLHELAHADAPTSGDVSAALSLDPGYLSRILARFQREGWLVRARDPGDARAFTLALTDAGRSAFAALDQATRDSVRALLAPLHPDRRRAVVDALATVTAAMEDPGAPEPIRLREPGPGDLGWVVERHGALYAQEYAWDATFEGAVAGIVAEFARDLDPDRERAWIAWKGDRRVGSVFLVRDPERADTAKLRLLLVDPSARGAGLGRMLVRECAAFAARRGYRRISLWTHDVLVSARRIYEAEGYTLVAEAPHRSWGRDLVGQTWELALGA